mmetsp:Transcript_24035/g.94679  ORF Transcript_24035/g.94679 Transcript_24035/m.94679 type:complete len:144 (-) Transcript_24035:29-460(-)
MEIAALESKSVNASAEIVKVLRCFRYYVIGKLRAAFIPSENTKGKPNAKTLHSTVHNQKTVPPKHNFQTSLFRLRIHPTSNSIRPRAAPSAVISKKHLITIVFQFQTPQTTARKKIPLRKKTRPEFDQHKQPWKGFQPTQPPY